ncbi:MAG TPA: hypothetical protein VF338_11765, partial [Leptolinea sp.]
RVFLVQNVHARAPILIQTRWCLNYLAGPMTRTQIPALNALAGVKAPAQAQTGKSPNAAVVIGSSADAVVTKPTTTQTASSGTYTSTRPGVPSGMDEVFLPVELSFSQAAQTSGVTVSQSGLVYKPALLAQLQINYLSRSYNLDSSRRLASLVEDETSGRITWEDFTFPEQDVKNLKAQRAPVDAVYDSIPGWLGDVKQLAKLQTDFEDWAYRTGTVSVLSNKSLKLNAAPGTKKEDFQATCQKAAEDAARNELAEIDREYADKSTVMENKLKKQQMEIKQKEDQLSARRTDEVVKGASVVGNVLFSLLGGKKSGLNSALSGGSSTLNKHRMAEDAAARVEQEKQDMAALEDQQTSLQKNKDNDQAAVREKWQKVAEDIQEVSVAPAKKDIYTELFGIAWLPYYTVKAGLEDRLILAFKR